MTLRKTIQLGYVGTNAQNYEFEKEIKVGFIPDEVIVRSLAYFNNSTPTSIYNVKCDFLNSFIGSVVDGQIYSPQTTFVLGKDCDRNWKFGLYADTANNANPNSFPTLVDTQVGTLTIVLEFVKYSPPAPVKIITDKSDKLAPMNKQFITQ